MRSMLWMATAAMMTAGGCATYSSYPPVEHSAELVSPEFEPMPTLMAASIAYANETWGDGSDDFAWNLPENSTPLVYNRVRRKLNAGRPMERAGETAFHVCAVRARGLAAEVDVVHPVRDGLYELATLNFKYELIGGWRVVDRRAWRIPKEAPAPTYAGPAAVDSSRSPVFAAPEPRMAPVERLPEAIEASNGNMQPLR